MLEQVRRSASSGSSIVLVAALIVVFIFFFGVPSDGCSSGPQSRQHVADVQGSAIHSDDINTIYFRSFGTQRRGTDQEIEQRQGLALKNYLMIRLFAERALDAGLRVGDAEFKNFMQDPVRNIEFAQYYGRDGYWDGEFYGNYVRSLLRVNVPAYEDFKRQELLARKYLSMVEMQVAALPQETAMLRELRGTKVNLEFVRFSADALAAATTISDEALQAFLGDKADEVRDAYDSRLDEYTTSEQLQIRRIYIERLDDEDDAQARFAEAKRRLDEGEDFSAVAGDINDIFKDKQGLMDFREPQNMDQSVVTALDEKAVGEVVEVTTDDAFMLVKLEDRREKKIQAFEDVRDDLARELLAQEKADALLKSLSTRLLEEAKSADSLAAALKKIKASETTGADPAPENDEDQATPESPWDAVTAQTTGEFTLEGQDMSAMFGGQLPPGLSVGLGAWDRIPKLGQSRAIAVDAFKTLSEEQPLAEKPYKVADDIVAVRLVDKTTPDQAAQDTGAEGTDAQPDAAEAAEEVRAKKVSELLGNWRMLFFAPSPDYGPWLEQQYKEAVDSDVISLRENAHNMVSYASPVQPAAPLEISTTDEPSEE